jgi:predicted RNA binding protein YcfA (HicA-like mRNA interferase family)
VGKHDKVLRQILSAQADHNIAYHDLAGLLLHLGFTLRHGKGSHAVFTRPGVLERLTLQPDGSKAKHYQVRQVRLVLTKYRFPFHEKP